VIPPDMVRTLVAGRLLVLQSKRLLLKSSERRMHDSSYEALRGRVDRLRMETALAQYNYRQSMLRYGTPEMHDYWPTAYSRLIEMGVLLSDRLRDAADDLPAAERYEASTDVEMLESMVSRWSQSMREAMAASVA
jgi:hypothetical protein